MCACGCVRAREKECERVCVGACVVACVRACARERLRECERVSEKDLKRVVLIFSSREERLFGIRKVNFEKQVRIILTLKIFERS